MHPFKEWICQLTCIEENNPIILAEEFFMVFSHFEYALKKARYVENINNTVRTDWKGFANKYNGVFGKIMKNNKVIERAVEFFRKEPPRKQVLKNNTLGWECTDNDRRIKAGQGKITLEWLTLMVRRVRNNLFHGGKEILSRPRDIQLLIFGLVLLRCWLDLDENVKKHFIDDLPGKETLRAQFCFSPQTEI